MTRKRPRRKDSLEKVKNWNSHKVMRADLMEANALKRNAGVRHAAGYVDRGRKVLIAQEQALHPLSRVLLVNPWVPAIRPTLYAHLREIIIQDTKIP